MRKFLTLLLALLAAPALLLAQTVVVAAPVVPAPAAPSFFAGILPVLLPIIVAALTVAGFELLQKGVAIIDGLPAAIKQVLVGVISYLLTAGSAALGIHLSTTDITGLSSADLSALISSGLAFVFHLSAQNTSVSTAVKAAPLTVVGSAAKAA